MGRILLQIHPILNMQISSTDDPMQLPAVQFAFTLRFPDGHLHHKDPLKLCFESKEDALEWQSTIARAVKNTAGGLESRDTGKILGDMTRKTNELDSREQAQPSASSFQRTSSVTAQVKCNFESFMT